MGAWAGMPASPAAASLNRTFHVDKAKSKSHSSSTTTSSTTTTTTASSTATTTPPTAADIELIRAIGAEQNLGSVRIRGTLLQGKTPIKLNLHVNGDGEGGGTFVQSGSTIQIKRVGTLLYFDAPLKFWEAHTTSANAKRYGGKWLEVSALNTQFESFDQFLNAGDLVSAVFYGHTNPLTLSKPKSFQGQKVVIVGDSVTVNGKKTSGKMYIRASGKPYVVQIVDKGPTESGTLTFSDYGRPISIVTPPEPINLSD